MNEIDKKIASWERLLEFIREGSLPGALRECINQLKECREDNDKKVAYITKLVDACQPCMKRIKQRTKDACIKNIPDPKNLVDKFHDMTIGELTVCEYYMKLIKQAIEEARGE